MSIKRPFINDFLKQFNEPNALVKVNINYVPCEEVIGNQTDAKYEETLIKEYKSSLNVATGYDLLVNVTVCDTTEPNMVGVVTVVEIPMEVIDHKIDGGE